jgi:hypothetical protein
VYAAVLSQEYNKEEFLQLGKQYKLLSKYLLEKPRGSDKNRKEIYKAEKN